VCPHHLEVKSIVQEKIGKYRANHSPLRGSVRGGAEGEPARPAGGDSGRSDASSGPGDPDSKRRQDIIGSQSTRGMNDARHVHAGVVDVYVTMVDVISNRRRPSRGNSSSPRQAA
jgi:hypothetical protein